MITVSSTSVINGVLLFVFSLMHLHLFEGSYLDHLLMIVVDVLACYVRCRQKVLVPTIAFPKEREIA